jgi:hypothetical protein
MTSIYIIMWLLLILYHYYLVITYLSTFLVLYNLFLLFWYYFYYVAWLQAFLKQCTLFLIYYKITYNFCIFLRRCILRWWIFIKYNSIWIISTLFTLFTIPRWSTIITIYMLCIIILWRCPLFQTLIKVIEVKQPQFLFINWFQYQCATWFPMCSFTLLLLFLYNWSFWEHD